MPSPKQTYPVVENSTRQLCQRVIDIVGKSKQMRRVIIAIAGPPAAGKSTLMPILINSLQNEFGSEHVVGVPMDGFHLDNIQLERNDTLNRKGAPHTFDVGGLLSLVSRLSTQESPIYAPEFDRANDLSRNCAISIESQHKVVLIEGNYLLLDQPGWLELNDYFDLTINGLSDTAALERAQSNDLPNAATVREQSLAADIVFRPENH